MSKKNKDAHASHGAHDAHRPNVKLFVAVFGALMVLTGVTVLVSKFHLPRPQAITLGLIIALVKAGLVAAIFMHLWGENKLIHRMLCVVGFFAAMIIIPIIDFTLLSSRMIDHAPVAAQHPDEGAGREESVTATATLAPPTPAAAPKAAAPKGKK